MSKLPNYIIFFCHGKSEITFVNEVIQKYLELKFSDFFGPDAGYYKNQNENPEIIFAKDFRGENYVSINSYKENIRSLIEATENKHNISNNSNMHAISIVDINEDQNEIFEKREEVLNNHEAIIREVCNDYDIKIEKSHLFYFKNKIEECLPDFYEITGGMKSPKQAKISKWANEKISQIWNEGRLTATKFKEMIETIENSNIVELIEQIDKWFEWLKS